MTVCECCGNLIADAPGDPVSARLDELLATCHARGMHVSLDLETGDFFVNERDAGELIGKSGLTLRNRRQQGEPLVVVGRFVGRRSEYRLRDLVKFEIELEAGGGGQRQSSSTADRR